SRARLVQHAGLLQMVDREAQQVGSRRPEPSGRTARDRVAVLVDGAVAGLAELHVSPRWARRLLEAGGLEAERLEHPRPHRLLERRVAGRGAGGARAPIAGVAVGEEPGGGRRQRLGGLAADAGGVAEQPAQGLVERQAAARERRREGLRDRGDPEGRVLANRLVASERELPRG